MLNQKLLDDVARQFAERLSNSPVRDLEKNARALLTSGLARLDLVTREEFEIQAELLAQCQARLLTLEKRLARLEEGHRDTA